MAGPSQLTIRTIFLASFVFTVWFQIVPLFLSSNPINFSPQDNPYDGPIVSNTSFEKQLDGALKHKLGPLQEKLRNIERLFEKSAKPNHGGDNSKEKMKLINDRIVQLEESLIKRIEKLERDSDSREIQSAGIKNTNFQVTNPELVTSNDKLPSWMKDYFSWHAREKNQLNATNWRDSSKFLILVCQKGSRCGGLSDRLKPLPLLILVAYQTKRLLLFHWEKPAKLEEYLMPNRLNWSVPEYMVDHISLGQERRGYKSFMKLRKGNVKAPIVNIVLQDFRGGLPEYEEITAAMHNVTEEGVNIDTYRNVYHDVFRYVFKPSPPVQKLIDEQMDKHGLRPGEYAVSHLRANYKIENNLEKQSPRHVLRQQAINAVNCASNLRPGGPVYFASDSKIAVEEALKYGKEMNRTVASFDGPEPLHIELQWKNHSIEEFYSVFVDLYMMGNGRCTDGIGGFGIYASLLSYDAQCTKILAFKKKLCEWTDKT